MSANERQVGGDHYKSKYQHWDWANNVGLAGLAYAASKYICRWRNKNGRQDVEKSLHYVEKMIEAAPVLIVYQNVRPLMASWVVTETKHFCDVNNIQGLERAVCFLLASWTSREHLTETKQAIVSLLTQIDANPKEVSFEGLGHVGQDKIEVAPTQ
jgi:hypothetical protein